ncbi:MAG: dicarboxylate/amino acid:cation symporter [Betaproteobacteria bacterium HGW-Betaproteobacteria-8]|nr:MAG: dicarboxylate/amino acid:cation symporter [Betaproteobacteria bacterium HGW-Betaproteobacteria-8]
MRLPSLNLQILLSAVLGLVIGLLFQTSGPENEIVKLGLYTSDIVGRIFIDLLKMILIPLVFTSIAVGIANLQGHGQIQRVWKLSLAYFLLTMMVAVFIAMLFSNIFKPGEGMYIAMFAGAMESFHADQLTLPQFFAQFLGRLFVNPFAAFAQNNVLAVVVFALFIGIALVMGGERYRHIHQLLQEFLELTMRIVGWVMIIAPLGIMALLIKLMATQDIAMFASLGKFVAIVLGTTFLHGLVILPLILYLVTRVRPQVFFRGSREAIITALATSSSAATLPVTMRCVEQNLGVKRDIAGFVAPLGATINMDGTALYEAAAALFIANLVGIELNLLQQMIVFFTAMIAAMGAPGIPSAGMVTMVMVLQSVGLPAEAIAILLPIDRALDTFRTAVNVEGDMVGSLVVDKLVNAEAGKS